jgi:hypothetical protein
LLGEEDHSHNEVGPEGDTAIQETQMYDTTTCIHTNIVRFVEEGEREGWCKARKSGPLISMHRGEPTRGDVNDEALLPGCTQMEMMIDGTQSGTQAPGRSIWLDFTSTVRDMAGPMFGGGNSCEACVQSKRGPTSSNKVGGGECAQNMLQ